MERLHENYAAIAVMGELYNSGKDIYDVLSAYLQIVIQSDNLNGFTCADITNRINRNNSFSVSESVVKTALKRLGLKRENGLYIVDETLNKTFDNSNFAELTKKNGIVIDKLFSFISKEKNQLLSGDEKAIIEKQFYDFLCDPECDESYSIQISKFLMENSTTPGFNESLSRIKEGLLVYEGICFSPEIGSTGKWVIDLDIYLELEVLFFIAGFNGDLHKEIYSQLIEYTEEINNANSQKHNTINLYYTSDVKSEIESYFLTAESIFDKNEIVDPSKTAMINILDGVSSKRDIQIKKVRFYNYLTKKGITEKVTDYFSEENLKYNIISGDVYQYNCENIKSDRGDEYIRRCSEKINQINILRKNNNNSLKEARSILLTANATILKCAYMPFAFKEGDTPKAVNLDYLITRLWYKLGKGFGKGETPKSLDIISRAQMIIASMTASKVSSAYAEIKEQFNKGIITDDQVATILVELRKASTNPEEITPEKIDEQVAFLTDYGLNKRIEDLKREELARQKDKNTIIELQNRLAESENNRIKENKEREEREKTLEKRISYLEDCNNHALQINNELVNTIQKHINNYNNRKLKILKFVRGFIYILGLFVIACVLSILCHLIFKFDKSLSGIISIALAVIFQLFTPMKKMWRKFVSEYKLKE